MFKSQLSAIQFLFISIMLVTAADSIFAETLDVGPQTGTYTGDTRGFWFTAPNDFVITALGLPTDASADNFDVAVLRSNVPIPSFPTTTTDFSTLFISKDNVGTSLLVTNIAISAGDIIGIFGSRGADAVNSYGANPYNSSIAGAPVTLARLLMQEDLRTTDPVAIGVSTEASSGAGRVIVEIESSSGFGSAVPIPTLQQWSLAILIMLTGLLGFYSLRKYKQDF